MYELARKFARIRFNVVKIQRLVSNQQDHSSPCLCCSWWRGRLTHLKIKTNQADREWTQLEKNKRMGLSR